MTQEVLKDLFTYDEYTGHFYHKSIRSGVTSISKPAGTHDSGYIRIRINGKSYRAHQLAWLYVYGAFPDLNIDHINHDRSDNRIVNLRLASNADNSRNMSKYKNNISGVTGVHWDNRRHMWEVQIYVDNKNKFIGRFKDFNDAISARKNAELKYEYHKNHGI